MIRRRFWPDRDQALLLGFCLLRDRADAIQSWKEWKARVDLDDLPNSSFPMMSMAYLRLIDLEIAEPDIGRIQAAHRFLWTQDENSFRGKRELLRALHGENIPTMVLGGAALARTVYPEPAARSTADTGILVPAAAAARAVQSLEERGWIARDFDPELPIYYSAGAALVHPDHGQVDLRWRILQSQGPPDLDDEFWQSAIPLECDGTPARILCPADQFLYACHHGSRRSSARQLQWLADCAFINRNSSVDWTRVATLAARLQLTVHARETLVYLRDHFESSIPAAISGLESGIRLKDKIEYILAGRPDAKQHDLTHKFGVAACRYLDLHGSGTLRQFRQDVPRFMRLLARRMQRRPRIVVQGMKAGPAPIWFINATGDISNLPALSHGARAAGQVIHLLHRPVDGEAIRQTFRAGDGLLHLIEVSDDAFDLGGFQEEAEMFFLDPSSAIDWSALQKRPSLSHPDCIQPLFAPPPYFDPLHCTTAPMDWWGWRATGGLARRILREPAAWRPNPVALIETIQHWSDPPRWQSTPIDLDGIDNYPITSPPVLNASSSVLVVLSFFRCEEWLNACLTGVTRQTRPPENIVVIDDCSPKLPLDLVEPFPNVTLLSTTRNIGPERILNNIIHATHYDAYMVQDPDDWSAHDRLEASLRGAEHSGAGLVASHEFRVNVLRQSLAYSIFPPDVNAAMARNTTHCILHPTSLISRALAMRVGGLDERLKVGADTEFHIRAVHAGRLVNLPGFYSFRRVRSGSMTTDPATGYGSAVRASEDEFITTSSRRNLALAESGQTPNFVVPHKDPVGFIHHRGPRLRLSERGLLV